VDNTYAWLGQAFENIMRDALCAKKPWYVWGVLQGAALAKVLEFTQVSAIEFGVAAGAGLLSLERTATRVEDLVGVGVVDPHLAQPNTGLTHTEVGRF